LTKFALLLLLKNKNYLCRDLCQKGLGNVWRMQMRTATSSEKRIKEKDKRKE